MTCQRRVHSKNGIDRYGKEIANRFWDSQAVIFVNYFENDKTIADVYLHRYWPAWKLSCWVKKSFSSQQPTNSLVYGCSRNNIEVRIPTCSTSPYYPQYCWYRNMTNWLAVTKCYWEILYSEKIMYFRFLQWPFKSPSFITGAALLVERESLRFSISENNNEEKSRS